MDTFDTRECQFILFTPRDLRLTRRLTRKDINTRALIHYCTPKWQVLARNLFRLPLPTFGTSLVYVPTKNSWMYRLVLGSKGLVGVQTIYPGKGLFSADTTWLYELE
ncbi:MAG: hypothetical protein RJB39_142 [Candidatus Parcubacteria bacterium]|jgi:hypothetical protein